MPRVLTVQLDAIRFERKCRALLLTRSDLAARLGCSRMTVRQAAVGKSIGIRTARRIARALRIPLGELIVSGDRLPESDVSDVLGAVGLPRNEVAK